MNAWFLQPCAVLGLLFGCTHAWAVKAPHVDAAEYYFRNQDYTRALALWSAQFEKQPDNVEAVVRVAELTLLLQGRPQLEEFVSRSITSRLKEFSAEELKQLAEELERLQSRFLTDKGQSRYLQSVEHFKVHNCKEALGLLEEGAALEKGNQRILRLKAACEAELEMWESRFATLKRAARANPLEADVQEALFELYAYFGDYARLSTDAQDRGAALMSARQKTAWAVALWYEKRVDAAWWVVRGLLSDNSAPKHPILYYLAGELVAGKNPAKAKQYFRTFLSRSGDKSETLIQGLDPYRTERYIPVAQKFMDLGA